jgi:hypothetical protein
VQLISPAASERAVRVRSLYQQLEVSNHNGAWTIEEDMLAFVLDKFEVNPEHNVKI